MARLSAHADSAAAYPQRRHSLQRGLSTRGDSQRHCECVRTGAAAGVGGRFGASRGRGRERSPRLLHRDRAPSPSGRMHSFVRCNVASRVTPADPRARRRWRCSWVRGTGRCSASAPRPAPRRKPWRRCISTSGSGPSFMFFSASAPPPAPIANVHPSVGDKASPAVEPAADSEPAAL